MSEPTKDIFNNLVILKNDGNLCMQVENGLLIPFTEFVDNIEKIVPIKDIKLVMPELSVEQIEGAFKFIRELVKMNYFRPEIKEISGEVKKAVDKHLDELDIKLESFKEQL